MCFLQPDEGSLGCLSAYNLHVKKTKSKPKPEDITKAMNRALAKIGKTKDPFVTAAARRILELAEW